MSVKTAQSVISVLRLSVVAAADTDAMTPLDNTGAVAADDGHILGVALNTVALGEDVAVLAQGQIEVISGGAIAALDYLKIAGGQFISASAADLAAGKVVGKALNAAAGGGDKFIALIGII